jgi:hypothetical protein
LSEKEKTSSAKGVLLWAFLVVGMIAIWTYLIVVPPGHSDKPNIVESKKAAILCCHHRLHNVDLHGTKPYITAEVYNHGNLLVCKFDTFWHLGRLLIADYSNRCEKIRSAIRRPARRQPLPPDQHLMPSTGVI